MEMLRRKVTVGCVGAEEDEDDGGPESRQSGRSGCSAPPTLKAGWTEYCNSTAIHGVRYFVEEGRTRGERVFWVLALALALVGSSHFINKVHTKWRDTPVLVSFAEKATPIHEVPFPAVTVCPEVKFRRSVFNFTEVYDRYKNYMEEMERNGTTLLPNVTEKEWRYLEAVSGNVCFDFDYLQFNKTPPRSLDALRELAPTVDEVLNSYILDGGYLAVCCGDDGSPIFYPVFTELGLCYTFNMLSNHELYTPLAVQYDDNRTSSPSRGWSLEDGYHNDTTLQTYPQRALGHGDITGLMLELRANKSDYDYHCRGPVQGFQVFRVPLRQDVAVVVKPSMMTTSEGLRDYKPSQRQCFFPSERHLKYFRIYTQKNCELECLANATNRMCGCVGFHMPKSLLYREAQRDLDNDVTKGNEDRDCNCLPACSSLEYDGRVSHFDYDYERRPNELWKLVPLGEGVAETRVTIYFNEAQFITSRRSELYAVTDFIANCGGLLSLFSGFSLISLIEILYHVSVRLWCNARRRQREHAKEAAPARPHAVGTEDVESVEEQPPSETMSETAL